MISITIKQKTALKYSAPFLLQITPDNQ